MVLNNYSGWFYGTCYGRSTAAKYYNTSGKLVELNPGSNNSTVGSIIYMYKDMSQLGQTCLSLGTNNAPVTSADYSWENEITTLTNISITLTAPIVNEKRVLRIVKTVSNNTSDDITVSELGLITCDYSRNKILIAREVLDQPVTIKPGGVQAFGIDIG